MICEIEFFSEAEFDGSNTLQTQEELVIGETLFITQEHTLTMDNIIFNNNKITILDGEKMLILKVI